MSRPNLFLIAAPRSGSTQLAQWLNSHPDISLSTIKEPNYFSAHEFDPAYVSASHLNDVDPAKYIRSQRRKPAQFAVFRKRDEYEALFANMQTPWRMEASTSYLSCPEAPELIHNYAPGARLIVLTRDPLKRAISHYRLACRTGRMRGPLITALNAEIAGETPLAARFLLRPSNVAAGMARIKALFEPDQYLFLEFETMVDDPQGALRKISKWLQITPSEFDLGLNAKNAGMAPRFAKLNSAMEKSGLKTALRRSLPAFVKPALKRLWFDPNRQISLTNLEIAALSAALEET